MKHRTLKSLFAAAALAVSLTVPAPASAATIQLGFILDSSGSIGAGNWTTIVNGLAAAINLIPIAGPDTYEVSVVTFSTGTQTIVNASLLNNAAARTAAANAVAGATFLNGNTNYAAAFTAMQGVLTGSANFSAGGISYVNFATDGEPNLPGATPLASGVAARDALIAAGIDNISIEGINIGAAGATILQNQFCYPGPCDTVLPFNTFPANGFYLGVNSAQEYADAIGNKVRVVTGQPIVPEPTSVVLLGTGLLFAASRLRRRK